jgi:flagellar protein FlbD
MIPVTRLDGQAMFLNNDLIESIEPTPDTLITMSNGEKLYVRETPEAVVDQVIRFKRAVLEGATLATPAGQVGGDVRWR